MQRPLEKSVPLLQTKASSSVQLPLEAMVPTPQVRPRQALPTRVAPVPQVSRLTQRPCCATVSGPQASDCAGTHSEPEITVPLPQVSD
jgi:hypothetical protein